MKGFRSQRKPQVAAYIRVSSTMKNQEESFENQAEYFEKLIRSNPEWDFVGIYGEQLSGTHAENRSKFQKLIQDAMDKKIDLVLCKSVSRWSRNMVDGLNAIKLLTGNGVHIRFLQEDIDTRTPGVILPLHLAQSVAQSVSESISENLKWTYRNKAARGEFWGVNGRYFVYDSKGDDFTENQDADTVRFIFQKFLEGVCMTGIAEELNRKGIKMAKGQEWSIHSIRSILKNEVYVGDVIFNKTPSKNVITGEIDKEWEPKYVRDHHRGIVDRATWNKAQTLLKDKKLRRKLQAEVVEEKPRKTTVSERMEPVMGLIREGMNTVKQIADEMGIAKPTLQYYLRKLADEGRVMNVENKWFLSTAPDPSSSSSSSSSSNSTGVRRCDGV